MAAKLIDRVIKFLNPQRFKVEKSYLDNILTEFKNKRPNYEEFRIAAHKALESLLKEEGYRYQLLSRTKTPDRLEEKLLRKKDQGLYYHSVEEVEDLVGIRIIFYTESDKNRFIKKLQNEMGGFMKIEERHKENGYKATHVIMSFGPKRLKLAEYKHFSGLKSEIQLTSILHHAWAEIEHDIIYKDVHKIKERDPEKFEIMKQKMDRLLRKYIEQASKELEDVINQSLN